MSKCKYYLTCMYDCPLSGASYLDDCPLEKYIPIYLVVSGSVGLFYNVFGIIKTTCCKKNTEEGAGEQEEGAASKLGTCLSSLLSCFMSAWFIAGKFQVHYQLYKNITLLTHAMLKPCIDMSK